MIAVAIGWQVYAIRRPPLDLGLVGLPSSLPLPLLALPAGQLADRVPRRRWSPRASLGCMVRRRAGLARDHGSRAALVWPFARRRTAAGIAFGMARRRADAESCRPSSLAARSVGDRQIDVVAGPAVGGLSSPSRSVYAVAACSSSPALSRSDRAVSRRGVGLAGLVARLPFIGARGSCSARSARPLRRPPRRGDRAAPVFARRHPRSVGGLGVLRPARRRRAASSAAQLPTRRPLPLAAAAADLSSRLRRRHDVVFGRRRRSLRSRSRCSRSPASST